MFIIQKMDWNDRQNRFEYTSQIYVCSSKKATDESINNMITQSWKDTFVSDISDRQITNDGFLQDYVYNWTDSDGWKRKHKSRLLVKKVNVIK